MTDTKLDLADYVGKGYGFLTFHGDPLQVVYQGERRVLPVFLCVQKVREMERSVWTGSDDKFITRIPQRVRLERWAVAAKYSAGWTAYGIFDSVKSAETMAADFPGSRVVPFTIEFEE